MLGEKLTGIFSQKKLEAAWTHMREPGENNRGGDQQVKPDQPKRLCLCSIGRVDRVASRSDVRVPRLSHARVPFCDALTGR